MSGARPWPILRESIRAARAQPFGTFVTAMAIAGMCATVLLTNGRAFAAEQAVLGAIDDAGTRTIVLRADPDTEISPAVVSRLDAVEGVDWVGAFGPATDVSNEAFPSGARVALRDLWAEDLRPLGISAAPLDVGPTAWLSDEAADTLGLAQPVGAVRSDAGQEFAIVGQLHRPDYLGFLDPLLLSPRDLDSQGSVAVLVVLAERPSLVAPLTEVTISMIGEVDPAKVKVETSQKLAELRELVRGKLGDSGRSLVVLAFAATAILVGAMQFGLVMMRRKDFGRRRALGASQALVFLLLVLQVGSVAVFGSVVGSAAAFVVLAATGAPIPSPYYFLAIGILSISVGVVAALAPAMVAARREPIHELRVP